MGIKNNKIKNVLKCIALLFILVVMLAGGKCVYDNLWPSNNVLFESFTETNAIVLILEYVGVSILILFSSGVCGSIALAMIMFFYYIFVMVKEKSSETK